LAGRGSSSPSPKPLAALHGGVQQTNIWTVYDMTITYGYPKDGRWDLKQFVLGMATDQHGIPLFL